MRTFLLVLGCLLLTANARAESQKITKADSELVLAMPYLEHGRESFDDLGWSGQKTVKTTYAAVVSTTGAYPRAQVYLSQLLPLNYWKTPSSLDATWVKQRFPFFRSKEVAITEAAPSTDRYLRVVRFAVGQDRCIGFQMLQLGNQGSAMAGNSQMNVEGIYCPPSGTALDEALIQRVANGVLVRRNNGVEPVMQAADKR